MYTLVDRHGGRTYTREYETEDEALQAFFNAPIMDHAHRELFAPNGESVKQFWEDSFSH